MIIYLHKENDTKDFFVNYLTISQEKMAFLKGLDIYIPLLNVVFFYYI